MRNSAERNVSWYSASRPVINIKKRKRGMHRRSHVLASMNTCVLRNIMRDSNAVLGLAPCRFRRSDVFSLTMPQSPLSHVSVAIESEPHLRLSHLEYLLEIPGRETTILLVACSFIGSVCPDFSSPPNNWGLVIKLHQVCIGEPQPSICQCRSSNFKSDCGGDCGSFLTYIRWCGRRTSQDLGL